MHAIVLSAFLVIRTTLGDLPQITEQIVAQGHWPAEMRQRLLLYTLQTAAYPSEFKLNNYKHKSLRGGFHFDTRLRPAYLAARAGVIERMERAIDQMRVKDSQ
jgi:hypothetical protein